MANETRTAPRKPRAAEFGFRAGQYGRGLNNAITDVAGVRVGHVTVRHGDGKLVVGKGPACTGVTVIVPATGDLWTRKIAGGQFVLNGNGEACGLMWLTESGIIETPIALTNTLSVGVVQQALVQWVLKEHPELGIDDDTFTPLVFECDDSTLSDVQGQHVKVEHVFKALEEAAAGPVAEGAVGAGTGMISYEFKGGIGTASRVLPASEGGYTVGVLLNTNHGRRHNLRFNGLALGDFIKDRMPTKGQDGSIVVVVATDAPMDGRQLSRLAKRSMLGVARTGAVAYHGSGDVAIAFSTANRIPHAPKAAEYNLRALSDRFVGNLFEAVADATEEAIFNALFAAETTVGRDGNTAYALPLDRLRELLARPSGSPSN